MKMLGISCYCEGHCPAGSNETCKARPGGQCFAAVEEVYDEETETVFLERSFGCLPPDETGFMQCKGSLVPHLRGKSILCCETEMCNKDLEPILIEKSTTTPSVTVVADTARTLLLLAGVAGAALVIILITLLACRRKRSERERKDLGFGGMLVHRSDPHAKLCDPSSGSGSGRPLLVQRTIARQIRMVEPVGKGKYGEVWLAHWRGDRVAVKIFFTTEEDSWRRETEIYQTVLMRHENILGFVGADIKGTGSWTQMILITDYHEYGSLHDYLPRVALDGDSLYVLAYSLASGLAHLHTEIFGTQGKPAVSHRDLKSKNVLVKRNGECAIADFGLAVRFAAERNIVDVAPNARVGTRRYMAPEALDETLDVTNFEAFKTADMYSFGLVLWEMCRRCATGAGDGALRVDDYAMPYQDCVPADPSFEDMRMVVCVKGVRPCVEPRWETDETLATVSKIAQECWHANPMVRLTALRAKKTLAKCGREARYSAESPAKPS